MISALQMAKLFPDKSVRHQGCVNVDLTTKLVIENENGLENVLGARVPQCCTSFVADSWVTTMWSGSLSARKERMTNKLTDYNNRYKLCLSKL